MIFECRLLKLLLKTYPREEVLKLLPEHNHDTRSKALKTIQANNNRGRSLLYTGVKLYNRYLLEYCTGSGNNPMSDLAERIWVYARQRALCRLVLRLIGLGGCLSWVTFGTAVTLVFGISGWTFAFLLLALYTTMPNSIYSIRNKKNLVLELNWALWDTNVY